MSLSNEPLWLLLKCLAIKMSLSLFSCSSVMEKVTFFLGFGCAAIVYIFAYMQIYNNSNKKQYKLLIETFDREYRR